MRRKTLSPVWVGEGADSMKSKVSESNTHQAGVPSKHKPYFRLESSCSLNPRLRVEVYDWDAVGSHDFLGGVELNMDQLIELHRVTLRKAKTSGNVDRQVRMKNL